MRHLLAPFKYVLGNSGFGLFFLNIGGGFDKRGKGLTCMCIYIYTCIHVKSICIYICSYLDVDVRLIGNLRGNGILPPPKKNVVHSVLKKDMVACSFC